MGDYVWSMNSDTSQGIVAVEYGRVLEYPKQRNKISDHEKARSLQRVRVEGSKILLTDFRSTAEARAHRDFFANLCQNLFCRVCPFLYGRNVFLP